MYLIKVRERKVTIPNKSPVNYAASVLQISPVFLQNFFIHSSSSDPSSMRDIFSAGVSLLQISFYCHLQIFFDCEKLYSKLFYFILNRINEVLGRDDSLVKSRIFISDGLGFENLPRHSNSLEQVNFSHLLLFIFYFLLIFVLSYAETTFTICSNKVSFSKKLLNLKQSTRKRNWTGTSKILD